MKFLSNVVRPKGAISTKIPSCFVNANLDRAIYLSATSTLTFGFDFKFYFTKSKCLFLPIPTQSMLDHFSAFGEKVDSEYRLIFA